MNRLAYIAIAYAVYLGVENWRRLERLEEVMTTHHRLYLSTLADVGRHVQR